MIEKITEVASEVVQIHKASWGAALGQEDHAEDICREFKRFKCCERVEMRLWSEVLESGLT